MADPRSNEIDPSPKSEDDRDARPRRPYEPPSCEKKRSIHRVTLLSGMGVMSMGVISVTN
jgi:hypothetical protein